MDPTYKIRNFFLKTAKTFSIIKEQEKTKNKKKLELIKEIEDDLFYMKESAKKMLREDKIKDKQYEKIIQKIKQIKTEIKKTKKEITNL